MSAALPERIGPYRVLRAIARGGMAEVFEVVDPASGEHLALKLLVQAGGALPRFLREYEAMIRLNHPNIVRVYHYGTHGTSPWLTMELIDGTPVQAYAKKLGRPGSPERTREMLRVAHDIALALDHIHSRGLVHRDLKSANVLVLPDGRVKLLDFGTAKVHDAMEKITREGEFVGTFAYASPEQLTNKPLDHRSDLYSLGILLYRLFTGRRPFEAPDLHTLARMHVKQAPQPPGELAEMPAELEGIILRLLEKRPDRRLSSGRAVAKGLEAIAGEPLVAPGTLDVEVSSVRLVGREDQIQEVRSFLDAGEPGAALLLLGPEGSGRRRVLATVEREVVERGLTVFHVRLPEQGTQEPVREMLEAVALAVRQSDEANVKKAVRLFDRLLTADDVEPERRRAGLAASGAVLLAALARQQRMPTVVLVHEAHRFSEPGLAMLATLRRHLVGAEGATLFLLEAEQLPGVATTEVQRRFPEAREVILGPLDERQVALLVGSLLLRRPPPASVARRIRQVSGGQPGYVEDVVRRLVDDGLLQVRGRDDNRLEWAEGEGLEIPVPDRVRAQLGAELAALAVDHRRVLEALAVLGAGAETGLVAEALDRRRTEIVPAIHALVRLGWLEVEEAGIGFRMSVAREVVEEGLHPCRRDVLIRRCVALLEDAPPAPAQVRLHLALGQVDEAVAYALDWAEETGASQTPIEALEVLDPVVSRADEVTRIEPEHLARLYLVHATCLLNARPTDASMARSLARAGKLGPPGRFQAEVTLTRARLQRVIGHYPNFRRHLKEAWAQIADDPPPDLASVIADQLGTSLQLEGLLDEAREWHERARKAALRTRNPRLLALTEVGWASSLLGRGQLSDAEKVAATVIHVFERMDEMRGLSLALPLGSEVLRQQGRFTEALARLGAALPLLRHGQSSSAYVRLLLAAAWCEVDLCRLGRAQECVDELAATLGRGEHLHLRLEAELVRGRILVASGLFETATDVLQSVVRRAEAAGLAVITARGRALAGEAHLGSGQTREGRKQLDQAIDDLKRMRHLPALAEAVVARSRALSTADDPELLFAPILEQLQDQPLYVVRLERILARGRHIAARGGDVRNIVRAAQQMLDHIGRGLGDTERSALRVHPWSRQLHTG